MSSRSPLPSGYSLHSSDLTDIDDIHELVNICERELLGEAESDRATVLAVFARPGFDPALDTVLIRDSTGSLIAHAWVDRRSDGNVHPGHHGRGLGEWLLNWIEDRAAQKGARELAQTVEDANRAASELLSAHGFVPTVAAWSLAIGLDNNLTAPMTPSGIAIRPFRQTDSASAHMLVEDAFTWQGRRRPYQEWAVLTVDRSSFSPDASVVAVAEGQTVGVLLAMNDPRSAEGHIEQLAVAENYRGQGIASALLQHAFDAFSRRERRYCSLWTHSATGALPLYERAGMTVRRSSTVYKKNLGTAF